MLDQKNIALVLCAAILSVGIVASTFKVANSLVEIKGPEQITVTGSAKTQIKSDLIQWQGNFSREAATTEEGYKLLSADKAKVTQYLKDKKVPSEEITLSSVMSYPIYELNFNGVSTNKVIAYRLTQTISIESHKVDEITQLSRDITELMQYGVEFQSMPPQYYYTKIADLKIDMLGLATKDAKARAEQISKNTGSAIGKLKNAKMGVFQITPLYSTDVSDSGINDSTAINKEVTAVVTCSFEVK